jgi:hypothetical protein
MTQSSTASPILVMSYNVSFQAMTHNAIGTAAALGRACVIKPGHHKLTICADQMAQLIEGVPATVGLDNFDFVGIQEASRWWELQLHAPTTLGRMEAVHSTSRPSVMASFYNSQKYDLLNEIHGEFSTGRPFQILVCQSRLDRETGVIFINAHFFHDDSRYAFNTISDYLTDAFADIGAGHRQRSYRIVVVGDFNEAAWDWERQELAVKTWTPIHGMEMDQTVSVENTPHTCCKSDGRWSDGAGGLRWGGRGGDYIFDSAQPAKLMIPENYNPEELCSDHLPVIAVLPPEARSALDPE